MASTAARDSRGDAGGSVASAFLAHARAVFERQKALAEAAIARLSAEHLHAVPHEGANSVAIHMRHIAGNMLSRWTDFLTTDGEKPWRNRDTEFVDEAESLAALRDRWDAGWGRLFATLDALRPDDLNRTVTIRGEPHTVLEAILRQVGHYGYHVGQIVQRARDLVGPAWKSLSIPRGESEAHNRRTWGTAAARGPIETPPA
jgi:hypothetical protein